MKTISTVTTTKTTVVITEKDIRKAFNLPSDAKLYIQIPTGGDYSGMTMELSDYVNGGITAQYSTVRSEGEKE